jgi:tRNA (guanosine-2'-O-)-methyltransferase
VSLDYDAAFLEHLKANWLSAARWARFAAVSAQRSRHITVVLDNIYQPHNASAALRSCDLFGVADAHLIHRAGAVAPRREIAMGAQKWVEIHRYGGGDDSSGAADCIGALRQAGYALVATTPHGSATALAELSIARPIALLFGEEKPGLSAEMLAAADLRLTIPMHGFTESFNVSVSVALCLYELSGRMRRSAVDWRLSEVERRTLALNWARRSIAEIATIEARFQADWGH